MVRAVSSTIEETAARRHRAYARFPVIDAA
jgi:hypothetical protein